MIKVNIETFKDALRSGNHDAIIEAFEMLLQEGLVLQIVRDYTNAPTEILFVIRTVEQLREWIEAGCPDHL